jgi:hypothetical protein
MTAAFCAMRANYIVSMKGRADDRQRVVPVKQLNRKKFMEATTRTVASHLILIQGEQEIAAAKDGILIIDSRPALIIRGIPAQDTIRAVYALFATRKDLTGSPFKLSHREKGIMHRDQWQDYSKLGSREFAKYLEHWTVLLDLSSYNGKPALVVVKSLPAMLAQLFHQPRYITAEMLAEFEWID